MVNSYIKKIKLFFKITVVLLSITSLTLADFALAKQTEITSKDVERIKNGLDLVKLFGNIVIDNQILKTVFNTSVGAGETGTDITYGLLVLSAMNEMELIDMVISQRFKMDATAYFDQIINERTNLIGYWRGTGIDILRVATGGIVGPMSALTLNSFSIGNTVLQIFFAVRNIAIVKMYNGLWYYFSLRRESNLSHKLAWEESKILMGWGGPTLSLNAINRDAELDQLESQFAKLWDVWGHYANEYGLTEQTKIQLKEEMGQLVMEAVVHHALAEKEPSWLEKMVNYLADKGYSVLTAIKSVISKILPFGGAGVGQVVSTTNTQPLSQPQDSQQLSSQEHVLNKQERGISSDNSSILAQLQHQLDQAAKMVEALNLQLLELLAQEEKEDIDEDKPKETQKSQTVSCPVNVNTASARELELITGIGPVLAQRIIDARPFALLSDLIRVSGIGTATLQKIIEQGCAFASGFTGQTSSSQGQTQGAQNTGQQEQEQEFLPASNLLLNDIFDDWEENNNKPTYWTGSHSFSTHWLQDADALVGNYSARVGTSATSTRTLSQTSLTVEATTYYALVYLKGGGQARVAILMGETGHTAYGPWTDIQADEWTQVTHIRSISAGNQGGIRIQTQGDQINTLIGAAWLGTAPPPDSWPQGLSPSPVDNFKVAGSEHNTATLTWSPAQDPDTPSEELSYKIYYSKEKITENNLTASSTLSVIATTTMAVIEDLYYDSTYYFAIKAFDRQKNHSELAAAPDFLQIPSALINSPWPVYRANQQRSGQSPHLGLHSTPQIFWVYNQEINNSNQNLNPYYTSPVIRPEGNILISVISPQDQKGILSLSPNGSKKSFQQDPDIGTALILQPNGSVLPDDYKVKSQDGKIYEIDEIQKDIIKAIDSSGQEIWQKEIDFPDSKDGSDIFSLIDLALSEDNNIYLVAEGKTFGPTKEYVYVFLLSQEAGEILWSYTIHGAYRPGSLSISSTGNVYLTYLIFGFSFPNLYLTSISPQGKFRWEESIVSNYSTSGPPSPIIIDREEILYFAVGKDIFAFNKEGGELWKITLGEAPVNWYLGDIGIALGFDQILYLSGRGAVFAVR